MLNKEDMNKYHTQDSQGYSQRTEGEFSQSAGATAKTVGGMAWRTVKTVLLVLIITGLLVFVSVMSYILSFRDVVPPNLSEAALSFSSKVYVTNDNGEEVEYMSFFANENRVWVSLRRCRPPRSALRTTGSTSTMVWTGATPWGLWPAW